MVSLPSFEMGESIPKKVHQIFFSDKAIPEEIEDNIDHIKKLNPSWEHHLYNYKDMEAIILKYYGTEIFDIFNSINISYGAAKADFFRYLLLYAEGGVYLDTKSSLTSSLDEVILDTDTYLLSKWNNEEDGKYPGWGKHEELEPYGGEYQQWHIICSAGHPFLRRVLERVINEIQNYSVFKHGYGHKGVLRTTGPIPYTLAIEDIKSHYMYRTVDIMNDLGFVYSIYENTTNFGRHKSLFGKHYSKLKSPIIKSGRARYFFYSMAYPVAKIKFKIMGKKLKRKAND